jgi:predicted lipoprotein with Yx(FWY)xxD motif
MLDQTAETLKNLKDTYISGGFVNAKIKAIITVLAVSLAFLGAVQSQTITQEEQQRQSIAYPEAQYYAELQRQTIGTTGAGIYEEQQRQSIALEAPYNQTVGQIAPETATTPSQHAVRAVESPTFGQYLADQRGFTLYYFENDTQGGSQCSGQCAVLWPPFYVQSGSLGPGLDASDFASINRTDGTTQLTFRGWPLYYYYRTRAQGMSTAREWAESGLR